MEKASVTWTMWTWITSGEFSKCCCKQIRVGEFIELSLWLEGFTDSAFGRAERTHNSDACVANI
jgi:hypothetical protein